MCEKDKLKMKAKKNDYICCRTEVIRSKSFRQEPLTCTSEKRILPSFQDNWTRREQTSRSSLFMSKFKFWIEIQLSSKEAGSGLRTSQAVSGEECPSSNFSFTGRNDIVEKSTIPARCFTIYFVSHYKARS